MNGAMEETTTNKVRDEVAVNRLKRDSDRYEPRLIDATVEIKNEERNVVGKVIDVSRTGIAIFFGISDHLRSENKFEIEIRDNTTEANCILGEAKLVRDWTTPPYLGEKPAAAFKFKKLIEGHAQEAALLRGIKKDDRYKSQAKLAKFDIEYLSEYRKSLVDCQMKLFMLALTTGVALGSAYFGLVYYSSIAKTLNNTNLSYWRAMVAAMPGILAMGCALMVAHKSISIQRIDAYLSILKECCLSRRFLREYKGWESEHRKFRVILKSNMCNDCDPKCGENLKPSDPKIGKRKFLTNPIPDTYHILVFATFLSIICLSIYSLITELIKYRNADFLKMTTSATIALILGATIFILIWIFKISETVNFQQIISRIPGVSSWQNVIINPCAIEGATIYTRMPPC
jgi:hypothetical protein